MHDKLTTELTGYQWEMLDHSTQSMHVPEGRIMGKSKPRVDKMGKHSPNPISGWNETETPSSFSGILLRFPRVDDSGCEHSDMFFFRSARILHNILQDASENRDLGVDSFGIFFF